MSTQKVDSESRSQHLFHYTNRAAKLINILREKRFQPSFCAEDFQWMTNPTAYYLLVPMVCFCDIPVQLSCDHRGWYGDYAIGLTKSWGKTGKLNPVFYVLDDGPISKALSISKFNQAMQRSPFSPVFFDDVWPILPYLKPFVGALPDYRCPQISLHEKVKFKSLAMRLINPTNAFHTYLRDKLPALTQFANGGTNKPDADENAFVQELNAVISGPLIYEQTRFSGVHLRIETSDLLKSILNGKDLETLNRMLLEDGCDGDLPKKGLGSKTKSFEDEMEWRFVPQNAVQHIYSFDSLDSGLWAIRQKMLELRTKASCENLVFDFADVEQIIVCKSDEKDSLALEFPALSGKITTWDDLGISCKEANSESESC